MSEIVSAADSFMTSADNPDSLMLPGLPKGTGGYPGDGLESVDFDTSDVIFEDMSSIELTKLKNKENSVKCKDESISDPEKNLSCSTLTKGKCLLAC